MGLIERWTIWKNVGKWDDTIDGPDTGEAYKDGARVVRESELETVRQQLQGAVEAGGALYAALRDGHSLGDEAVHDAMARWEALTLTTNRGQ